MEVTVRRPSIRDSSHICHLIDLETVFSSTLKTGNSSPRPAGQRNKHMETAGHPEALGSIFMTVSSCSTEGTELPSVHAVLFCSRPMTSHFHVEQGKQKDK